MARYANAEAKLATLVEIMGYETEFEMLEKATFDSVADAICINDDCDYATEMEPDQDKGWCEECEANTIVSCLVLKGII